MGNCRSKGKARSRTLKLAVLYMERKCSSAAGQGLGKEGRGNSLVVKFQPVFLNRRGQDTESLEHFCAPCFKPQQNRCVHKLTTNKVALEAELKCRNQLG